MGYKQANNPMKMMKSALKMHKAEKKAGMHRDSAMYMNSPMYKGHSPMEMGHESPANKESRELKDMPIVDIEKGDAKGSPAKMNHSEGTPANHYFDPMHKQHKDDHKDSPAKKYDEVVLGGNKGDKSKTKPGKKDYEGSPAKAAKPDYIDIDGDGDKNESMKEAAKDKKKGSPANMGHKDSPAELSWDDIKKAGRTAVQLGKDVVYQLGDMVVPDPIRTGGTGSRESRYLSRDQKLREKKNYDQSRKLRDEGKTFFSAADLFDDSGYGNITGTNEEAKRKDIGDAKW